MGYFRPRIPGNPALPMASAIIQGKHGTSLGREHSKSLIGFQRTVERFQLGNGKWTPVHSILSECWVHIGIMVRIIADTWSMCLNKSTKRLPRPARGNRSDNPPYFKFCSFLTIYHSVFPLSHLNRLVTLLQRVQSLLLRVRAALRSA